MRTIAPYPSAIRQVFTLLEFYQRQRVLPYIFPIILLCVYSGWYQFFDFSFSHMGNTVDLDLTDANLLLPLCLLISFTGNRLLLTTSRLHYSSFDSFIRTAPISSRVNFYTQVGSTYSAVFIYGIILFVLRILSMPTDLYVFTKHQDDQTLSALISGCGPTDWGTTVPFGTLVYASRQLFILLAYTMASQIFFAQIAESPVRIRIVCAIIYLGVGVFLPLFVMLPIGGTTLGTVTFVLFYYCQVLLWPALIAGIIATQIWAERRFSLLEIEK